MKKLGRPIQDLLIAVGLAVLFGVAAFYFDFGEDVIGWVSEHEPWELDELLLFTWAAGLFTAWYAWRRYREAREESAERRRVEESLREAQRSLEQRVADRTQALSEANASLQREIVARASVEQNLRESNEQLSMLLASLPVAPYRLTLAEGRQFVYLSESAERLTGYSSEEFMTQPTFWPDHVHPDDLPVVMAAFDATDEDRQVRERISVSRRRRQLSVVRRFGAHGATPGRTGEICRRRSD